MVSELLFYLRDSATQELTEQEVCVGESWPRLLSVCTHDRGQDSPTQTDLARLIRYLFGKTKNNLIRLTVTVLY